MTEAQGASANLAATNDAMQGIINAAGAGGFHVAPEAGNELIRAFEDFQDELPRMWRDGDYLKTKLPLGDSPAGQAIAAFNQNVAAGEDGRSYVELLLQLRTRIPQVVEAIKKGMQQYQDTDQDNARFGV